MAAEPAKKTGWPYYAVTIVVGLAYIYLTLSAPRSEASRQALRLSDFQVLILQLTIVFPYLFAWLAGVHGSIVLKRCGNLQKENDERSGFRSLAAGILMLVIGSMTTSIIGTFRQHLAASPSALPVITIVNNYVYMLAALFSFLFFFLGARKLVSKGERVHENDDRVMTGVLMLIVAALYLPLVFTNAARQATEASATASYYLPDALILLTLILPFFAAWGLGILAALRLSRYAPPSRSLAQKRALRTVVNGFWTTIFASILLQVLVSVGSTRLTGLGIASLLVIVYLLIGVQIAGFLLLSLGSDRLSSAMQAADKAEREDV